MKISRNLLKQIINEEIKYLLEDYKANVDQTLPKVLGWLDQVNSSQPFYFFGHQTINTAVDPIFSTGLSKALPDWSGTMSLHNINSLKANIQDMVDSHVGKQSGQRAGFAHRGANAIIIWAIPKKIIDSFPGDKTSTKVDQYAENLLDTKKSTSFKEKPLAAILIQDDGRIGIKPPR